MKYLKILLIPFITFMFMVPTKALDEVPEWLQGGNDYVVVGNIYDDKLDAYVLQSPNSVKVFINPSNKRLAVGANFVISKLCLKPNGWTDSCGSTTVKDSNGTLYYLLRYLDGESSSYIKYSSFDIMNGTELVFPRTPVTNLAMVTQKAVETLEMEVQGTSGTISLVGGVILGTLLVVHLVSRLRYWVRV